MDDERADDPGGNRYFTARAEHLIGQVVGTRDASADHPAGGDNETVGRVVALEARLADAERRLAELERRLTEHD